MSDWVTIGRVADVPPGHAAATEIDGTRIAVFNVNGEFHVLDDTCSHAEASLSEGELDVETCTIECPLHGSQFDLASGRPLCLPAVEPVRVHRVDTSDGMLRVALSDD